MKAKRQNQAPLLDDDLLSVFKETFAGDDQSFNEAVREARRAFAYVERDDLWNDINCTNDIN